VIGIRLMTRPSLVRNAEKRRRRGCVGVEALEGRTLLSLTLQTHPIPETAGFGVEQIVPGPDGNLWFTAVPDVAVDPLNPAPPAGVVGVMTPTGTVRIFSLPTDSGPGAITAGPDGNIWIVEFTGTLMSPPAVGFPPGPYTITESLVRITPEGVMTSFALPSSLQDDSGLLTGPDGNLWVVGPGQVATVTPEGVVTVMNVGSTTTDDFEGPVFGSDGNLWVGSGNDANPQIDRITPEGVITRFAMPSQVTTEPYDLVDGPDGNVWFLSNGVQALIGKISSSGVVTTYQTPANLNVNSIAASPTNNSLWFTAAAYPEVDPNPIQIGRITTDGTITVGPAESSSIIGYGQLTFGPGGNLWFLESTESTTESSGLIQGIGEADFAPLKVTGLAWVNPVHQAGAEVVLTFSGSPDPTTADDSDNYGLELVRATRHGFVTVRSVAINSAEYDATDRTVTLRLGRRLSPLLHYRVSVNGQRLTDTDGQQLSGAGTGHPGTNFLALVRRAKHRHPVVYGAILTETAGHG
jgi:virginiamycin B lyase